MTTLSASDQELLLQTFLTEAGEHLGTLEEGLVVLEDRPGDSETINELFRVSHSLKGDAKMVGFPHIAELAHVMEDLLERLRDGSIVVTPELVTLLLQAVDALRAMVRAAAQRDQALPAGLDALREALRTAAAATATPASAPAPAEHAAAHTGESEARTLRVEIGKLDRLLRRDLPLPPGSRRSIDMRDPNDVIRISHR